MKSNFVPRALGVAAGLSLIAGAAVAAPASNWDALRSDGMPVARGWSYTPTQAPLTAETAYTAGYTSTGSPVGTDRYWVAGRDPATNNGPVYDLEAGHHFVLGAVSTAGSADKGNFQWSAGAQLSKVNSASFAAPTLLGGKAVLSGYTLDAHAKAVFEHVFTGYHAGYTEETLDLGQVQPLFPAPMGSQTAYMASIKTVAAKQHYRSAYLSKEIGYVGDKWSVSGVGVLARNTSENGSFSQRHQRPVLLFRARYADLKPLGNGYYLDYGYNAQLRVTQRHDGGMDLPAAEEFYLYNANGATLTPRAATVDQGAVAHVATAKHLVLNYWYVVTSLGMSGGHGRAGATRYQDEAHPYYFGPALSLAASRQICSAELDAAISVMSATTRSTHVPANRVTLCLGLRM